MKIRAAGNELSAEQCGRFSEDGIQKTYKE
jgi:hypothetical protein